MITQILYLCLISYPAAKAMDTITKIRIIKDLADEGYTFRNNVNANKLNITSKFDNYKLLPIVNIFANALVGITYLNNKEAVLNKLDENNMIIKLDYRIEDQYKKNPGYISALKAYHNNPSINTVKESKPVEKKETRSKGLLDDNEINELYNEYQKRQNERDTQEVVNLVEEALLNFEKELEEKENKSRKLRK
jgi:hypothetical protein